MGHGTAKMSTGQFREFAGAVLRSLPDDLDETVVRGWIDNQESLRRVIREALAPNGKPAGSTYPLSVNYGMSVEDAVKLGRYNWANGDINDKNFPTKRTGKAEVVVELIHFDRYISTDNALHELDRMGMRPIELHELLAFGEKYSDVQREFPIVALGSVWQDRDGSRRVPCLGGNGSGRRLSLGWFEGDWGDVYWFAAVRK